MRCKIWMYPFLQKDVSGSCLVKTAAGMRQRFICMPLSTVSGHNSITTRAVIKKLKVNGMEAWLIWSKMIHLDLAVWTILSIPCLTKCDSKEIMSRHHQHSLAGTTTSIVISHLKVIQKVYWKNTESISQDKHDKVTSTLWSDVMTKSDESLKF